VVGPVSSASVPPAGTASGRQPGMQGSSATAPSGAGAAASGGATSPAVSAAATASAVVSSLPLTRADALLQTADAALSRMALLAGAMQALAAEALNPAANARQVAVLNILFQQLRRQMRAIGEATTFDGVRILAGGGRDGAPLFIGVPLDAAAGRQISLSLPSALLADIAPRLAGAAIDTRPGAEQARASAEALSPAAGLVPPPAGARGRDSSGRGSRGRPRPDSAPEEAVTVLLIAEAAYAEILGLLEGMAEMAVEAGRSLGAGRGAGLDALFSETRKRIADIAARTMIDGVAILDGDADAAIPPAAPEALAPELGRAALTSPEAVRAAQQAVDTALAAALERRRALAADIEAARRLLGPGEGAVAAQRAALARQREILHREAAPMTAPRNPEIARNARNASRQVAEMSPESRLEPPDRDEALRMQAMLRTAPEGGQRR
jgi:hypothetical protein